MNTTYKIKKNTKKQFILPNLKDPYSNRKKNDQFRGFSFTYHTILYLCTQYPHLAKDMRLFDIGNLLPTFELYWKSSYKCLRKFAKEYNLKEKRSGDAPLDYRLSRNKNVIFVMLLKYLGIKIPSLTYNIMSLILNVSIQEHNIITYVPKPLQTILTITYVIIHINNKLFLLFYKVFNTSNNILFTIYCNLELYSLSFSFKRQVSPFFRKWFNSVPYLDYYAIKFETLIFPYTYESYKFYLNCTINMSQYLYNFKFFFNHLYEELIIIKHNLQYASLYVYAIKKNEYIPTEYGLSRRHVLNETRGIDNKAIESFIKESYKLFMKLCIKEYYIEQILYFKIKLKSHYHIISSFKPLIILKTSTWPLERKAHVPHLSTSLKPKYTKYVDEKEYEYDIII